VVENGSVFRPGAAEISSKKLSVARSEAMPAVGQESRPLFSWKH